MTAAFDPPLASCPCCHSPAIHRYHRDSDGIVIFRCRDCRVQFMNPQYSDAYLREYYSRYTVDEPQWDEPLMVCHHFYVSLVERVIPERGRLLDVGSGKGHLLRAAAERGWNAEGYEIDAATAAATGRKIGLTVHAGDFPSLPLPDGTYDAVTLHHVLEHLKDPGPYLRKISALLRPGGVLFVALPNIRGLASTVKFVLERAGIRRTNIGAYYDTSHHVTYFTPASLRRLLARYGFSDMTARSGYRVKPGQSSLARWVMRNITERFVWKSTFCALVIKKN